MTTEWESKHNGFNEFKKLKGECHIGRDGEVVGVDLREAGIGVNMIKYIIWACQRINKITF